jgi:uncharacterized protein (TIGR02466 family)
MKVEPNEFEPSKIENFNFFSTSVTVIQPSTEFANYLNDLYPMIEVLKDSAKSDYQTQSIVNGWRIENPHLRDEFKVVSLYLQATLSKLPLVAKLAKQSPAKFSLASWLNVHNINGHNKQHHHGASFLSGIVYLKVPEGSGQLKLRDPRAGKWFAKHFYDDCSTEISVKPREGMTIVFPGFLEHYVETSCYKALTDKRVSIAFNLNIVG